MLAAPDEGVRLLQLHHGRIQPFPHKGRHNSVMGWTAGGAPICGQNLDSHGAAEIPVLLHESLSWKQSSKIKVFESFELTASLGHGCSVTHVWGFVRCLLWLQS